MSRTSRALASLAVLALAAGAGCTDEAAGDTPAATVNGIEITSQDVVDELEAIRGNAAFLEQAEASMAQQGLTVLGDEDDTFNSTFVAQTLTDRILYAIVESEVEARDIEVDDACLAAAEEQQVSQLDSGTGDGEAVLDAFPADYREYLVGRFADVIALQGGLAGYPCTILDDDALLQDYFDSHLEELTPRCVSVVQFADPIEADEFRQQVEDGGDFATLGAALDPNVGAYTEVGCDSTQEILDIYPDLASMREGDVSPVFLASDTPVVLQLDSIGEPNFEEQRDAVRAAIGAEIDDAFGAWLETELRAADVTVDPRYGTWNPDGASGPQIDRPVGDTTSSTEPEAELVPED